jgi:hypothetical protein
MLYCQHDDQDRHSIDHISDVVCVYYRCGLLLYVSLAFSFE